MTPRGRCPFGTEPTTRPENRLYRSPDLWATRIPQSMGPEYSLHPLVSRARGDTPPCPGSLSTPAWEAETGGPSPRRR